MPTTTRRQHGIDGLTHIIEHVFKMDPNTSNIAKALSAASITSIFDLLSMKSDELKELTFVPDGDDTTPKQLPKGDRGLISCLQDLVIWKGFRKEPIANDFWSTLTDDEFDKFRTDPEFLNWKIHGINPIGTTPSSYRGNASPASTTSTPKYTSVDLFRRGIKRDPASFPTLKDERYHDNWHRSFSIQAKAQDVANVLDASYAPTTTEDKELFGEQKKYLYAVLEKTVLTDYGKSIIRQHETSGDAQAVYKSNT